MVGALDTFIGRLNNDNSDDQIPGWAVDTIKEWWKSHVAHATDHCKSEEKTYKPIFGERFIWPTEIDTLHDELDSVKDEVQTIMDKINKEKVSLTAVRDALAGYEETMLKHFEVEEMKVLPLMRAHFTAEELSITNRKVLEDASENAMGALIYAMSPDGNKFRSDFMKIRGIPSFVWYLAFKPRLNHYTKDVVAKVEAIESGEQPSARKKSSWL